MASNWGWMLCAWCLSASALAQEPAPVASPSAIASPAPPEKPSDPGQAAAAAPSPAPAPGAPRKEVRGVFVGDELRYPRYGLLPGLGLRVLADLIAIPSGIPGWSASDFAVAGSVVALSAAMSISVKGPSLDVQIQRTFQRVLGGPGRMQLWSPYGDFLIWSGIWALTASIFVYGLAMEEPRYVETAALMVEAFAVTQIFHLGLKLLTGRQGPKDEDGQGYYGGPAFFFRYFPSGTPSGHVATMYALFGALMTYWDTPLVNIGLGTVALVFSATIIADDYHYATDVILGAALGYCVGRWVVQHRSTRFHNGDDGKVHEWTDQLTVAPALFPGGGGLAASITF